MRYLQLTLLMLLLTSLLIDAVAVGSTYCYGCHGRAVGGRTTVVPGPGCTGSGCHPTLDSTYISTSVHYPLRTATLIRPAPPSDRNYCYCHSTGRGMTPSCVCHVVIHIRLSNHSYTYPYPILVAGYLPWGVSYPSLKPGTQYKFAKLLYNCGVYCPPNLYKIWQQYAGKTNTVVVAVWDWLSGDVVLPLPGGGPAGIGGAYGRLEADSWKSCFTCHVAAVSPWTVVAGYNGTPVSRRGTDTLYVQHPDVCQPCHGVSAYAAMDSMPSPTWTHNLVGYIYGGPDAVWGNCGQCHSAIQQKVSQSVHAGLGCRCHAVVHLGYAYGGSWMAALFTYEGSGVGVETAPNVVRLVRVYTQSNATPGVYSLFSNVSSVAGPGRNIEAGLWDAYKNDFLTTLSFPATSSSRFGNPGLGPTRVWTACFNCHFLAVDPSKVSDPHSIKWRFTAGEWDAAAGAWGAEGGGGQLESAQRSSGLPFVSTVFAVAVLLGGLLYVAKKAKI